MAEANENQMQLDLFRLVGEREYLAFYWRRKCEEMTAEIQLIHQELDKLKAGYGRLESPVNHLGLHNSGPADSEGERLRRNLTMFSGPVEHGGRDAETGPIAGEVPGEGERSLE